MAFERITMDPAVMAGAPTIAGTRVTVSAVLGQLGAGQTIEQIVQDYPSLRREDIVAAIEFATATLPTELPFAAA